MPREPGDGGFIALAAQVESDRRRRRFTEVAFALVGAGVVLLLVIPRLPVPGVRRLGGGLLLGFGAWLDLAAAREWRAVAAALSANRPVAFSRLPGRLVSGLAMGIGLGLLLLELAPRR
ncbi:MAG TPA: hypothetical protein VHL53_10790 [Acidimicrobiia bacterium]|nr:hypothetical protein [Acidimicrobiia bacterium]